MYTEPFPGIAIYRYRYRNLSSWIKEASTSDTCFDMVVMSCNLSEGHICIPMLSHLGSRPNRSNSQTTFGSVPFPFHSYSFYTSVTSCVFLPCLKPTCVFLQCLRLACVFLQCVRPTCVFLQCLRPACVFLQCVRPTCVFLQCLRPACVFLQCVRPTCVFLQCLRLACVFLQCVRPTCVFLQCLRPACVFLQCVRPTCVFLQCLRLACVFLQCLRPACVFLQCLRPACVFLQCLKPTCVFLQWLKPTCVFLQWLRLACVFLRASRCNFAEVEGHMMIFPRRRQTEVCDNLLICRLRTGVSLAVLSGGHYRPWHPSEWRRRPNSKVSLFLLLPLPGPLCDIPATTYVHTVKPLYNGHIGPCKNGPYNEVASLLR